MKIHHLKSLVLGLLVLAGLTAQAQHPRLTIKEIQEVSQSRLQACDDTCAYFGDTVTVVAVVIQDANLIDVPSSSVQGGFRPFVHVLDTANGGQGGDYHGLQVMGVYTDGSGASLPVSNVFNLYAGMVVEVTGILSRYQGETQLAILDNSSLTVLGSQGAPSPIKIDLGDLNDNTRTNILTTGEQYEDSYVEINDVTVTNVQNFNGNRVSFDVVDANGNVINVSDRFLAQKTASYTTTRPSSPVTQGSFVPPVVGTKFDHIRGIVMHSENGCTGSSGRGYEINPTRAGDYLVGKTPPNISQVVRMPLVPKDGEKAMISATIVDFDGSVTSAKMFYSSNLTDTYDKFTEVSMTLKSGTTDTYEAEIPGMAENTVVRYYLYAVDDISQESYMPFSANAAKDPNFAFYTVRNGGLSIADIQRVLNVANDASPFNGQEVTVTGVVTSSAKAYDLEQIYIQDPNATEWGAIKCQGNSDLIKLFRGQEVTVTGTVAESFGFTIMNVSDVVVTGNLLEVPIVTLDPSDSAFYNSKEAEKYESMLVGMTNPGSGKIYITNPQYNAFGEYLISTDANATYGKSRRVQAGIQNTNNSSSLWVSIVSDSTLKDSEGIMNVAPIQAKNGMSFDTIVGILYYGFGNYNLLPRNDDDFKGSSVALPATDYPEIVSVRNINASSQWLRFYPNPADNVVTVDLNKAGISHLTLNIIDLSGKHIKSVEVSNQGTLDVSDLNPGIYVIEGSNANLSLGNFRLIKK